MIRLRVTRGFGTVLARWQTRVDAIAAETSQRAAEIAVENMIIGGIYSPGTPVDTGRARNSWAIVPPGKPGPAFDPKSVVTDRTGLTAVVNARVVIRQMDPLSPKTLASECPYMGRLEYGWSKQAPNGFRRFVIRAWPAIVRRAWREARERAPRVS